MRELAHELCVTHELCFMCTGERTGQRAESGTGREGGGEEGRRQRRERGEKKREHLDRGDDEAEECHVDGFAGLDDLCERHSARAHGQHRATVRGSREETCGRSVRKKTMKPCTCAQQSL